jgi:hypothetical protein
VISISWVFNENAARRNMMMDLFKQSKWVLVLALICIVLMSSGPVYAATSNDALSIPNITISDSPQSLGTIRITERNIPTIMPPNTTPLQIIVTLPSGSRFVSTPVPGDEKSFLSVPGLVEQIPGGLSLDDLRINSASTYRTLIIDVVNRSNTNGRGVFDILFNSEHSKVLIGSATGDYKVSISEASNYLGTERAVTKSEVINARLTGGYTTCQVVELPALTQGIGRVLGEIRLIENVPGSLQAAQHAVSLTLPQGVTWSRAHLRLSGGFNERDVSIDPKKGIDFDASGRSRLWLDINHNSLNFPWPVYPSHKTDGNPGVITIYGYVNIAPTAVPGQLVMNVGGAGQDISPQSLVIATISGTEASTTQFQISTFTIGDGVFKLNGLDVLMETAPYIENGRTYLPLRYVAYSLGVPESGIYWNSSDRTVALTKGNQVIKLEIGQPFLTVNGRNIGQLDVVPEIRNGLTMLPVGVIVDKLGGQVDWDEIKQEVKITYPKPSSGPAL